MTMMRALKLSTLLNRFVLNNYDEDHHGMHGDERPNSSIEDSAEVSAADYRKSMQSASF